MATTATMTVDSDKVVMTDSLSLATVPLQRAEMIDHYEIRYVFNLFSHNAPIVSNGYNEEEMKLVKETRKIWNDKDVRVSATCIRVPVMRANVESVNLQFENPLDEVKHGLGTFKSSLKGGVHIVKADQEDTTWKNPEPNHYHAKRSSYCPEDT
ncbi:hypothetical protein LWI28_020426 [Acer negundo]|uniref:Semialdehyde dehydrogenase dimerisation domain-containing protein n=1 Tax=Acer negundo TaxID=4023 RepID=A0AAD5JEQ7_ACENE|nr:hypothetical protein LWI28_020426 [Acer negundo]